MQWEIKSVLPPRRRATQTGGKRCHLKVQGKGFHFTTEFCSGTSYKALLFLTNTKCILFQFKFNTQCRFLLRSNFFPIHIRLRFATITLLIGCNLKNLGAIKRHFCVCISQTEKFCLQAIKMLTPDKEGWVLN